MIEPFDLRAIPDGEGLGLPSVNAQIWAQTLGHAVIAVHSWMDQEVLRRRFEGLEATMAQKSFPWGWGLDLEFDTGLLLCFSHDEFLQSLSVSIMRDKAGDEVAIDHRGDYIPWGQPPFSVPPEAAHLVGNPIVGVSLYQRFLEEDGGDATSGRPVETALCFELARNPNVFVAASMSIAGDPQLIFDGGGLRQRLRPIGYVRLP